MFLDENTVGYSSRFSLERDHYCWNSSLWQNLKKQPSFFPGLLGDESTYQSVAVESGSSSGVTSRLAGSAATASGFSHGGSSNTGAEGASIETNQLISGGKSSITSTVTRVRYIDSSNSKDQGKIKRKQAQSYKRVSSFLQGQMGIELSSANPDHLPVIVLDLPWIDIRAFGTVLAKGIAAEIDAFIVDNVTLKKTLRLLLAELRVRGRKGSESLGFTTTVSSNHSHVSTDGGQLFYAMLYSTTDDRYEMISYTLSSIGV